MTETVNNNSIENKERTLLEGLLFYLSYVLRHKWLIIIITMLFAIGSVAFSLYSLRVPPEESPLPNYYQAYAVLIVEQGGAGDMSMMLASFGIQAPGGGSDLNYGELGMRVLRSRPFIDEIVDKFNIIERHEIDEKVKTNS